MLSEPSIDENAHGARPKCVGKILVFCAEDWFMLSHFKPLVRRLKCLADEVVVATHSTGRIAEVELLGVRAIECNFERGSMNPLREAANVYRIASLLINERPNVVHLIAMKPAVIGGLASLIVQPQHTVIHMTGLGYLVTSQSITARIARHCSLMVIRRLMYTRNNWLLVENREDLALLINAGVQSQSRLTILGGAGVNPDEFCPSSKGSRHLPVVTYVGRIIHSKGVDVLMAAADLLHERGVRLEVEMYGDTDNDNPGAMSTATLADWGSRGDRRFLGRTQDVVAALQRSDIFVLPARSREGMPRALLEAAACEKACIVTDVPGCREFVTDGVNGLVVPPNDAPALADAIERLILSPDLRAQLGAAARAKVIKGFTEKHIEASIEAAYRSMLRSGSTMSDGRIGDSTA